MNDAISFAIVLSLKSDETMLCYFFFFFFEWIDPYSIQKKYNINCQQKLSSFRLFENILHFRIIDTINNKLSMNFQGRFRITEILRQLQKLSFP